MKNEIPTINTVQLTEHTAAPKEQSENVLFDILQENITDNTTYCIAIRDKLLNIPYAHLPEFFTHHCNFIYDPIKYRKTYLY